MHIYAGTSGYSYKSWKGSFYPDDLPARKFLSFYGQQLPAVEINNTFYRMPKAETLETWRDSVPEGFRFVLKASRRITHHQRLRDSDDSLRYLIDTSAALGERRGPFLFQLPPYLKKDLDRLRSFLDLVPENVQVAMEFRNQSWFDDETLSVLEERGAALCVADTGGDKDTPFAATTDWGYLRLRREDYDDEALADWAERVCQQSWREAFVFFKHEEEGAGPRMAARFLELLD